MNKKRMRQMSGSLLRRLNTQPAARYLSDKRDWYTRLLEEENFIQRFAPLYRGERLACAEILSLCREELNALSPEPEEGWIAFT